MSSNNPENRNPIAGALTFPSRSQDAQPLPEQPRQPRNLQGLLRFAMEATKAEDAPGNSDLGPMDEERRQFLEQALKSLTVDVAQVLQNSIRVLSDAERMHSIQLGQELPEDVSRAFTSLMDFIDDVDTANDFYKLGGFAIFPVCYGSENDEIRARACSIMAELCQNNPFCQARVLESGLLNVLLTLVQTERGVALVKCIYAISCACREYPPSCRELIAQDGCPSLAQLIACSDVRARTKAAFLVRYLCAHYPDAKEKFIKLNIIRTIAQKISEGRDESSEHLLSTILVLVEDQDSALEQCREQALGLKNIIRRHLDHPDLKDNTFSEEKEYAMILLDKVFKDCPDVDGTVEEADR